jgi:ribosomal subunit interface protein
MRIQVRKSDVELSELLRAHVQGRLDLPPARFGDRIGEAIVQLAASGRDRRSQTEVGMCPTMVRVDDTETDMLAAVERASRRLSQSVARALDREHAWDDGPLPPGASTSCRK